jgi:hypothetical protein
MAHFAKLDDNNVVTAVHVVNNEVIMVDGVESEQAGIDFLVDLYGGSDNWKQCSYNKSFRKNYPSGGFIYDEALDAFIPPKMYASWTLNEATCIWEAPTPRPDDENMYTWNEETTSWVTV